MAESPSSSSSSPSSSFSNCNYIIHHNNNDLHHDHHGGLDLNVMVLVAAIVCAFLCALGLNTMLHCVFQCVIIEPLQWLASRRLNSGLNKKDMVALPTSTFSTKNNTTSEYSSSSSSSNSTNIDNNSNSDIPSSPIINCAICLADFNDGDRIRFLPKCNHRFHVACIDKWLLSHSSCPTCRHFLKSSSSSTTSTTTHSLHHSLHIVVGKT